MKTVLILVLGCTAILAQNNNTELTGRNLQNTNIEDIFGGLINEENKDDDEVITQAALSILTSGRPNCTNEENWGHRFPHNWYVSQFWQCNRTETNLHMCPIPRLYQPSSEGCVFAWNWKWEPIRRKQQTTTLPPDTTAPTTDAPITTTTEITTESWLPPRRSRCDAPNCRDEIPFKLHPSHEPSQFHRCTIFGLYLTFTCPTPLLFNYRRELCMHPARYTYENPC